VAPSGLNVTAPGLPPTGIVAVTDAVAVSITEIVLLAELGTYSTAPSGLSVGASGLAPTGMVAVTAPVAVSSTETVCVPELTT